MRYVLVELGAEHVAWSFQIDFLFRPFVLLCCSLKPNYVALLTLRLLVCCVCEP